MSIKTDRAAYTQGWQDAKANHWLLDQRYPRPTQELPRSATLSDGTVVTGSSAVGWKPPFAKALNANDADLLADLWRHPIQTMPVDDV